MGSRFVLHRLFRSTANCMHAIQIYRIVMAWFVLLRNVRKPNGVERGGGIVPHRPVVAAAALFVQHVLRIEKDLGTVAEGRVPLASLIMASEMKQQQRSKNKAARV